MFIFLLILVCMLEANIMFEFPKEFSTMSLKKSFLQKFKDIGCVNFFETGTCVGGTLRAAAQVFDICYSVELDDYFYDLSCKNLSDLKNIKIFKDTSINALKKHSKKLKGLTLYWLDAHNSPSIKPGKNNCPLLEEIDWIFNNIPLDDFILLIDDVRCSTWPLVDWQSLKINNKNIDSLYNDIGLGWPTFETLKKNILAKNLQIALIGDVLAVFSNKNAKFFDSFIIYLVNILDNKKYEFDDKIKNNINYKHEAQLWIDSLNICEEPIYHNHFYDIKNIFNN